MRVIERPQLKAAQSMYGAGCKTHECSKWPWAVVWSFTNAEDRFGMSANLPQPRTQL